MTENSKAASNQTASRGPNTSTQTKGTKSGRQRPVKPMLKQRTPEEEKLFQEGVAKAEAEKKARGELVGSWEKRVQGMSYRQIRGELKRVIRGKFLGESTTPLDQAWAVIANITMQTTKMRDNLAGQLSAVLNPTIAANSPRYTL